MRAILSGSTGHVIALVLTSETITRLDVRETCVQKHTPLRVLYAYMRIVMNIVENIGDYVDRVNT